VRISKTLQKNLQKQQAWGGATSVKKQVSGTASSVAFTPLQVRYILNDLYISIEGWVEVTCFKAISIYFY